MKKILIVFIFIALPVILRAALTGNGTYASPWSGTLEGDATWSGTIYINGDIIVDNEKLTVSSGAIIIFLSETADLIITGTGQLEADGTPGSMIRFTSDDNNNGNFGESGERWGHISFEAMGSAGASLIDNCIIEFGDVSSTSLTPANPKQYGGAIHSDFSNLTISYCEVRNNKAGWGGGIFINIGENPAITNCYIHDNIATTSGGGIYFWTDTYSNFSNSIITYNNCSGAGGGGGIFLGNQALNVKIINCVISHNSANSQTLGHNIKFFNNTRATKPQFINSIVWYPANSIVYTTSVANSADFVYCAIQNPPITTYTGLVTLNASNTGLNPQGPFFKTMSGSDWSIDVISPCRDAGTTPSPTVPNDYAGNTRVRNYDIGAYEVQYNYWLTTAGSSDWNTGGNWNGGLPTSSQNVVIPAGATNYPTGSSSLDYTIGAGYGLVLEPGAKATFNTLTKTGDLKLMSNSSATSSLITNNSVNAIIELYLTGGGGTNYKWHYISSPVSSLPVNTFVLTSTMDFAQFFEARPVTAPQQGWVAYDGWYYSGGYFLTGSPYVISGTNMNVGQGYNYYYPTDYKFSFSGSTNISTASPAITFGGNASLHGFNLLGNPFTSGLNWTTIINDAGFPTSTSKGLYYTRNNSQCSFIAGVGYPDATVTGVIPPMQGFFIHTTNTSATLPLLSSARVHNIPARYKGGEEIIPLVRLQLDNDTLMDNTVVRFDTKASASYDNDFDAVRMFLPESVQYIYSTDGATKYAINGQPFSETEVLIPISVNVITSGNHTITASQLQGLDDYDVKLNDKVTGFIADLKTNPVITFSSEIGTFADRFVLQISNITTGETPVEYLNNDNFNIYQASSFINILTVSDAWDGKTGSMKIYNLTGQMIGSDNGVEFNKNSLIQIPEPSVKGLYFVELKSGMQRYVGKVIVK